MSTILTAKATRLPKTCTCTDLGAKLRDYVLDLLEDLAAEEVEDHLLDCRNCRDRYLKALNILGTADGSEPELSQGERCALKGARVLRMADFKKR
jgi:hypothetical protein